MFILFLILVIVSALLLILLVMVQDDQGEGLGGIFGGGSSTPFGSTSGNILTKATTIVAVVFLASVFMLALVNKSAQDDDIRQAAQERQFQENQENTWFVDTTEADTNRINLDDTGSLITGDENTDTPSAPEGNSSEQLDTAPGTETTQTE
ncbi:MAG: preprotein translocase subunit SecG [Spirochaetales bacterium]|nr:preprotein translocase subunit SecG [Spirochaetales bacterium]